MNFRKSYSALLLLIFGLVNSTSALSNAIFPGGVDETGLPTDFEGSISDIGTIGWRVGNFQNPIEVSYSDNNTPWIKNFNFDPLLIDEFGVLFFEIEEWLTVGGTQAWTDWHQEILTPGWVFETVSIASPDVPSINTLATVNGPSVDFDFSQPLFPEDKVSLIMRLNWTLMEPPAGVIEIAQAPTSTVPEPAPLLLMGVGIACLGFAHKKRGHK